ncbi:Hypothetical protein CAP_5882 [Chondromyces apiculatus DSM 436]|uniref:HTH luxR-type domain-containing protein n=1 Tax=Chondromyces apiculatus DSM 436 TaxID=1192034 RepID=A0A017TGT9_9BACT|nr:Hypothetical protein CAP_5882 [Chondromyces apiculatus DSM 436]
MAACPSVEEIVRSVHHQRTAERVAWSPDERKVIKDARRTLASLHPAVSIEKIFATIQSCYPFEGAMFESYVPFERTEVTDTLYDVSDAFMDRVAHAAEIDPTVDIVSRLPEGTAARVTDCFAVPALLELEFFQAIFTDQEFDASSFLTLSVGPATRPHENIALYMFHGKGERRPTWRQCRLLEVLCGDIKAALQRLKLPLLPHEPIRYHVLRAEQTGYVILGHDLTIIESNTRSHVIAAGYVAAKGSVRSVGPPLSQLMQRILQAKTGSPGARLPLVRRDGGASLQVHVYPLGKELTGFEECVWLVELTERPWVEERARGARRKLTARQQQIASLLAMTGLSYKEIAAQMGISEGTMRVHARSIYRAVGVSSRPELMARWR